MSFTPICQPADLPMLSFKDYKTDVFASIKKMHKKGHINLQNLVPIFWDIEHLFADKQTEMLMVSGKLNSWKGFIKNALSKDASQVLKAYAYVSFTEKEGYVLHVAPVKGKMKNITKLRPAFKALVGTKVGLNILADMEENLDMEDSINNRPEQEDQDDQSPVDLNNFDAFEAEFPSIRDKYMQWLVSGDDNSRQALITRINKFYEAGQPKGVPDSEKALVQSYLDRLNGNKVLNPATDDFKMWAGTIQRNFNAWVASEAKDTNIQKYLLDLIKGYQQAGKIPEAQAKQMNMLVYLLENPIDARIIYLDLKDELSELSDMSSFFGDDEFKALITIVEQFINCSGLKLKKDNLGALLGHIVAYIREVNPLSTGKPKLVARLQYLGKMQTALSELVKPTPTTLNVRPEQLAGDTFGDRGTAGQQKSSEEAKNKRDATVDERALELAKLLNLGKNKDSDRLFADVIRFLFEDGSGQLESKYTAATLIRSKKSSTLGADIQGSFGTGLRGQYLQSLLNNNPSPYAMAAAAAGALGKNKFAQLFSGEEADLMKIITTKYNSKQLQGLVDMVDDFAKAAFEALDEDQKNQVKRKLASSKEREALQNASTEQEKETIKTRLNEANFSYLRSILIKVNNEAWVSADVDKIYKELNSWAAQASEEERQAMADPNGKFMKSATIFTQTGWGNTNELALKQITRILTQPRPKPEEEEAIKTHSAFNEIEKIALEQSDKWAYTRWKENKTIGKKIQDILLSDDIENPQSAIVLKFLPGEHPDFIATLPNVEPDRQQAIDRKKDIVNRAMAKMNLLLDKTGLHSEYQLQINEYIASDGTKGLAYQKIAKLAAEAGPLTLGLADDVLEILADLDADDSELATLKQDTDLLETLKYHIIGRISGGDDWAKIVKVLSLSGELAKIERQTVKKDTAKTYKQNASKSKGKIVTEEERKQLEEQAKQLQTQPSYWALWISERYNKGFFSTDSFAVAKTIYEAKKSGADWNLVKTQLQTENPKAYNFIQSILDDGNQGEKTISAKSLLELLAKSRTTSADQITAKMNELVDDLDSDELLQECFNLDELNKKAQELVDKKQQALQDFNNADPNSDRSQLQKALDEANAEAEETVPMMLRGLDVSAEFTNLLNKALPAHKAFEIKTKIRDKVVSELAKVEENKLQTLLPKFSKADISLLVEYIRAISSNEKEGSSLSGVQYRNLTSRGIQRDIAAAQHAQKVAAAQFKLASKEFKSLPESEKAEAIAQMAKEMEKTGVEKEEKRKEFEETKKKYDERVKMVVKAVTSAVMKAATMPLNSIPLLGKLISTVVETSIEGILSKVLGGDRVGTWKDVAKDTFKKVAINLAKELLLAAIPAIAGVAFDVTKDLVDGATAQVNAILDRIRQSSDFINNTVNAMINLGDKINAIQEQIISSIKNSQAYQAISNFVDKVKAEIERLKTYVTTEGGWIGQQAWNLAESKAPEIAEALLDKVNIVKKEYEELKARARESLKDRFGKLEKLLTVAEKVSGFVEQLQTIYAASGNQAALNMLERAKASNPNRTEEELIQLLKANAERYNLQDTKWDEITSIDKLEETLNEAIDELQESMTENVLDPAADKLLGVVEEEEESPELESAAQDQLSTESPKESLQKIVDALNVQKQPVPELISQLLISL